MNPLNNENKIDESNAQQDAVIAYIQSVLGGPGTINNKPSESPCSTVNDITAELGGRDGKSVYSMETLAEPKTWNLLAVDVTGSKPESQAVDQKPKDSSTSEIKDKDGNGIPDEYDKSPTKEIKDKDGNGIPDEYDKLGTEKMENVIQPNPSQISQDKNVNNQDKNVDNAHKTDSDGDGLVDAIDKKDQTRAERANEVREDIARIAGKGNSKSDLKNFVKGVDSVANISMAQDIISAITESSEGSGLLGQGKGQDSKGGPGNMDLFPKDDDKKSGILFQ
ncbi:MAG: hypothetical protein LBJ94_01525 [Puniceicoccales bacterium]|jgi:hypothetical protein|nr:hypothetical protein [Puniceicoccales bacterium]